MNISSEILCCGLCWVDSLSFVASGVVGKQTVSRQGRSVERCRLQKLQLLAPSKFCLRSCCVNSVILGMTGKMSGADAPLVQHFHFLTFRIFCRENCLSASYQRSTQTPKSIFAAQNSSVPFANMEAIVVSRSLCQRITHSPLSKWKANDRRILHYQRWQRNIASTGRDELVTRHSKKSAPQQRIRKWEKQRKTLPTGTNFNTFVKSSKLL